MKILYWIDENGNSGNGLPVNDNLCNIWISAMNNKYPNILHYGV